MASCTAEPGTVTVKGDPDFTCEWSGSSASVTITVGDKADFGTDSGKAGQLDFTSITITTNDEAAGQVAQPTITPGSSYILGESTEVTLECSTDGAKSTILLMEANHQSQQLFTTDRSLFLKHAQ